MDVVLSAGRGHIVVFFVRDGRLIGRETFMLASSGDDSDLSCVSAFIKQHYAQQNAGPSEIVVKQMPDDRELIEGYLSRTWKRNVRLTVPERGEKKALLDMSLNNVEEMSKTIDEREKNRSEREDALGKLMHSLLSEMGAKGIKESYSGQRFRIEAYDISNTNGVDTVGAMVVYRGLRPDRKAYRRFRVKSVDGPDDYA